MRIFFLLITLLFATAVSASELTAAQLQEYCNETEKGLLGQKFDQQKSEICKGYIMGFFDSMIMVEQFAGARQFCMPASLPKTQNNLIINNWVKQYSKVADTTTASVALFAAYVKAFPCK